MATKKDAVRITKQKDYADVKAKWQEQWDEKYLTPTQKATKAKAEKAAKAE